MFPGGAAGKASLVLVLAAARRGRPGRLPPWKLESLPPPHPWAAERWRIGPETRGFGPSAHHSMVQYSCGFFFLKMTFKRPCLF